jgi:hypothetical protein
VKRLFDATEESVSIQEAPKFDSGSSSEEEVALPKLMRKPKSAEIAFTEAIPHRPVLASRPGAPSSSTAFVRMASFYSIDEEMTTEQNEWVKECRAMGISLDPEVRQLQKARVVMRADPDAPLPMKKVIELKPDLIGEVESLKNLVLDDEGGSGEDMPTKKRDVRFRGIATNGENANTAESTTNSSSTTTANASTTTAESTTKATTTDPSNTGDVIDVTLLDGTTRERIKMVRFDTHYNSPEIRKSRVNKEKEEMEKVYNERLKLKYVILVFRFVLFCFVCLFVCSVVLFIFSSICLIC